MKKVGSWLKSIAKTLPIIVIIAFVGITFGNQGDSKTFQNPKEAKYVEFKEQVEKNTITDVQINKEKSVVLYKTEKDKVFSTEYPDYNDFKKELLEQGIAVESVKSSNKGLFVSNLLSLLFFGFIGYYLFSQIRMQKALSNGPNDGGFEVIDKPDVKFKDVAGCDEVLSEVQTVVDILENGTKYQEQGAKLPKGMILYGPPGTGKTLVAKSIAGEAGVPFFTVNGGDFIEKYVGTGASRVRKLFADAKKKAPCIIFIDEIDAIGGVRGENTHGEYVQTLNVLLSELDGFSSETGVFVIATTNHLTNLDPALIRAGRFDLHVKVPVPSTPDERLKIIEVHTAGKKFAEDVNFKALAKQWIGFSGADIASVFNDSAIIAVTEEKDAIDNDCIDKAYYKKILKGHLKKGSQTKRDDDELKLVAYHEAGHAVMEKILSTGYDVSKVTILSSTTGAGGVTFSVPKKMGLFTVDELKAKIKVLYGGRVAERLLFGDEKHVTTGAVSDIEQATENIKQIISTYGMDNEVGMLNLRILDVEKSVLFTQAKKLSETLFDETMAEMQEHWYIVEAVAEALLEKETISEEELDAIYEKAKRDHKVTSSIPA